MRESCPQRDYVEVVDAAKSSEWLLHATPDLIQSYDSQQGNASGSHTVEETPVSGNMPIIPYKHA